MCSSFRSHWSVPVPFNSAPTRAHWLDIVASTADEGLTNVSQRTAERRSVGELACMQPNFSTLKRLTPFALPISKTTLTKHAMRNHGNIIKSKKTPSSAAPPIIVGSQSAPVGSMQSSAKTPNRPAHPQPRHFGREPSPALPPALDIGTTFDSQPSGQTNPWFYEEMNSSPLHTMDGPVSHGSRTSSEGGSTLSSICSDASLPAVAFNGKSEVGSDLLAHPYQPSVGMPVGEVVPWADSSFEFHHHAPRYAYSQQQPNYFAHHPAYNGANHLVQGTQHHPQHHMMDTPAATYPVRLNPLSPPPPPLTRHPSYQYAAGLPGPIMPPSPRRVDSGESHNKSGQPSRAATPAPGQHAPAFNMFSGQESGVASQ